MLKPSVRSRALLLVGYTGGLRRSELAALTVEDLAWVPGGAVLTLRRSKTDQAGHAMCAMPRSFGTGRQASSGSEPYEFCIGLGHGIG